MHKKKPFISIREPKQDDEHNFLAAMHCSQTLHALWTQPPQNTQEYQNYLERSQQDNSKFYLVLDQDEKHHRSL